MAQAGTGGWKSGSEENGAVTKRLGSGWGRTEAGGDRRDPQSRGEVHHPLEAQALGGGGMSTHRPAVVLGNISPYPMVVSIVNVKYVELIVVHLVGLSSYGIPICEMVRSGGESAVVRGRAVGADAWPRADAEGDEEWRGLG